MTDTLPRWDLTGVFPSVTSRAFTDALEEVGAEVARLVARYDALGIEAGPPRDPGPAERAAVEEVLAATNDVLDRLARLDTYLYAHTTTDSRDDDAASATSRLDRHTIAMRQLSSRLGAWVASLGAAELAEAGPVAADHAYPLARAAARAEHQMSSGEESLYAELSTTGSLAWARLHGDVTSQLTAEVALPDGSSRRLPMAAVRGLATDPDPVVRRAAYDAELEAWPTVAVACAAALNAVKGEAVTVNARRGWADPLDASLFANAVDRPTFEAMRAAVEESLPDFRRYLRTKARLHGHDGPLPWWDLFAPLPAGGSDPVAWADGVARVEGAFARYSPTLAGLVRRAGEERWIDAEPRDGKRGGAYCAGGLGGGRSVVFLNWSASADSVQTLAHELGHAYHNVQLADRTPLQRQLTMALAETASIFCETLMVEAGLAAAEGAERFVLLDTDLQGTTQVVVDILSRLRFEAAVFERRRQGTLPWKELNALMLDAQESAYGDGIDLSTRHPWMWAVKPHYYSSHFYNWPYTYGLLFGLGLYSRYQADPERFRQGYDDLLSAVGLADAATLGKRFGIDVHDVGFWRSALDTARARIDAFEALATTV